MEQLCTISTVHTVNRVLISIAHTVLISIVHTVLISIVYTVLIYIVHTVLISIVHTVLISIQSMGSCHHEPLFLSCWMHPATQKLESPDASGDSSFRVNICIR